MSYDNPDRRMYSFGNFDFGGGADETFFIMGPKGKKGRLVDYGVFGVTEVFAAGTATPMMSVGTAGDPDYYGDDYDFGALADNSGKSIRSAYRTDEAGFATYMLHQELPADTLVGVKCIAGTGSGLTGQAIPFVVIDWDW